MKKILISFGGKPVGNNRHLLEFGIVRDYSAEVKRLLKSGEKYNFDDYWGEYDNEWLKNSKYWETDAIRVFKEPSFGWAFKSICIYDALNRVEDGDVILYIDSNDILINDPQPIIDFAIRYGIYSHDHTPTYYSNGDWTQRDMFIRMGCDEERYWNAPQIQVNIMAFCKNDFVMNFVGEWVKYSTDYETMIQNIYPNLPGFKEHRHEQSVFSILREKYKLVTTRGYPYTVAREEMGINAK